MRRKDRELDDQNDLEQIIAACDVCRIAFADNNIPYIVTLNFGYRGGDKRCFFFHCAKEGRKIDLMKKNNYVCFEMDTDHLLYDGPAACDWGMRFSSVVGYGRLTLIENQTEREKALNCMMEHYTKRSDFTFNENTFGKTAILRLDVEEMSGKRKV
jgi:uncharacterized protein